MTPKPFRCTLAASALAMLPAFAASATQAQTPVPLRVGVEAGYPPFSSLAPDGSVVGFDIDIANAICAWLKTPCVFVKTEFDAMIPALRAKKFDLIVPSNPKFFGDGPAIAVRKGETELLARINKALAAILADGTYQKLQSKYFDFDVAPLQKK